MRAHRKFLALALALPLATGGLLSLSATLLAAEEAEIVARVEGAEITRSELMDSAAELPAAYQANLDQVLPALLDRLINAKLASRAGRAQGLNDDPLLLEQLAVAEERLIGQYFLEIEVEKKVTDATVAERFALLSANAEPKKEVKARHILLADDAAAREVIADLDAGGDFAGLAKERSTGPSGPQGGDLGYFTADRMVAPFAEAAFAMAPGSYSKEPVQTQFGFHVILVEDVRETPPPGFEEMEPQIRQALTNEALREIIVTLRQDAEVEIFLSPPQPVEEPAE